MSPDRPRQRLPFEPAKSRKKQANRDSGTPSETAKPENAAKPAGKPARGKETRKPRRENMAIPEAVSGRMVSRMVILSGIPLLAAIATFVGSYFIVINEVFPLPNTAVLLVSMGCFGLSVVGLSYGVLSASWDENEAGSLLGWREFQVNFGRMVEAWRANRQQKSDKN
jgi:hypothetical protein